MYITPKNYFFVFLFPIERALALGFYCIGILHFLFHSLPHHHKEICANYLSELVNCEGGKKIRNGVAPWKVISYMGILMDFLFSLLICYNGKLKDYYTLVIIILLEKKNFESPFTFLEGFHVFVYSYRLDGSIMY